jgi:hypothetical protein
MIVSLTRCRLTSECITFSAGLNHNPILNLPNTPIRSSSPSLIISLTSESLPTFAITTKPNCLRNRRMLIREAPSPLALYVAFTGYVGKSSRHRYRSFFVYNPRRPNIAILKAERTGSIQPRSRVSGKSQMVCAYVSDCEYVTDIFRRLEISFRSMVPALFSIYFLILVAESAQRDKMEGIFLSGTEILL